MTVSPVVVFNPVAGVHVHVPSFPSAKSVTEAPLQMVVSAEVVIVTGHCENKPKEKVRAAKRKNARILF